MLDTMHPTVYHSPSSVRGSEASASNHAVRQMQEAFMSVSKSAVACVLGLAMTTGGAALAQTGDDPALKNMNACLSGNNPGSEAAFMTNLNPALNDPDRVAW